MTVVVTGGSGGIGTACVEALRSIDSHVVTIDLQESSPADEHIQLDLASEDCGQVLERALSGAEIKVLVNNAAFVDYSTALDTSIESWNRTIAVNLRAPFLVTRALYPMLRSARGSVINVSSVHANATSPGIAAYAAAKGGLVSLTRALALEWAPEVRVNALLPGAVETEMLTRGLERSGMSPEDLADRHPLGRLARPEEIAAGVLFLARSDSMTGSSIVIDGGATARLSTE